MNKYGASSRRWFCFGTIENTRVVDTCSMEMVLVLLHRSERTRLIVLIHRGWVAKHSLLS